MEGFLGKWKLSKSTKFDEFMTAVGVNFVLKKMANLATPTQTITQNEDGEIHIKTETSFKTTDLKFKLGEEFEEKTADGRSVKTTINLEDGKLVQIQPGSSGKDISITREIKDEIYLMTLVCKNVTCTREYSKLAE
ncbi:fatty acid-binding protein, liver-like [Tubulanus polymorphus]|uniref:fatty acid-binding protein, liver-like n=1 Tax=Tubulanus polymorphus TaxID=672921 RepID=UPI003DA397D2